MAPLVTAMTPAVFGQYGVLATQRAKASGKSVKVLRIVTVASIYR
jgi:hypothetical protein